MIDLGVPQRQSPLAMVFLALKTLRSLGIAQLVVAILFLAQAPLNGPLVVLPIGLILALAGFSALAWWRYTFMLTDGELVVTKGVVRSDRLTVPVDRIQSMAIDQELLHRLTGLVKLSVDTAGSSEAEFSIDAVARPVAEELQRQAVTSVSGVAGGSPVAPASPTAVGVEPEIEVFSHSPGRLIATAVTMWPISGLVVLGPILAFGDEITGFAPDSMALDLDGGDLSVWLIPVGVAVFIAGSVMLNVVRVLFQEWELTLRSTGSSLRRTAGLLSRTSKASSVSRVQVVSSVQNPLQRRVGLRQIQLSTIGEGDLVLPGCNDDQWNTVRRLAQPGVDVSQPMERLISPASIFLATRNSAIGATLIAVAGWFVVGWWALLSFVIVPWRWWTETRRVRNYRWSVAQDLATSSRIFDSQTERALLRKTNAVSVTQTIFERRRSLAKVVMSTGAGAITVGMIPADEAGALRDLILHRAETDPDPWM